jgi:hypothetical protein
MNMNQPIGQQLANNDILTNIKNSVSDAAAGTTNALNGLRNNINSSFAAQISVARNHAIR